MSEKNLSSGKKKHPNYDELPEVVKKYLEKTDYELIIEAVKIMELEENYGVSFSPILNHLHAHVYNFACNLHSDEKERAVMKQFIRETFPLDYLKASEDYRPGILDVETDRNLNSGEEKDRL